jgi:dipeptidyl aminopeptidase/acylaminoacyl peptidase
MPERRVSFFSDGIRLSGVLVEGAEAPRRPAVVYSHGWSGAVNDRVLPLMRTLAADGFVGLAIDHRGFAGSDGPRCRCDPREQARDVSSGVSYLLGRPDIDPARIVVIGASFGGSIAVAASAADERISALVAIVAIGDSGRWLRSLHGENAWSALQERLHADAIERARGGPGERVPFGSLLPAPTRHEEPSGEDPIARMYPGGFPLENLELAARFRPELAIADIAPRPVVLVGVDDDTVVPVSETLQLFERAGEPKRLVRYPTGDHVGPLGEHCEATAGVIRALVAELGAAST